MIDSEKIVDAFHYTGKEHISALEFINGDGIEFSIKDKNRINIGFYIKILVEGEPEQIVHEGEWILRSITGKYSVRKSFDIKELEK